jgi:hypothetical protein
MKLIAFLQLYNENETGNLKRCLDNCKQWADEIFIYDDCSTDGSQEIYLNYTDKKNIIFGDVRNFKMEIFHKQQLLELALKSNPDWIGWIDGDAILSNNLINNCKNILSDLSNKYDGVYLHNINMWRDESYRRLDNNFDDLYHLVFWRNNGKLYYDPVPELHQIQYPKGILDKDMYKMNENTGNVLLHYGFSSKYLILRKYLIYKSYGQKGKDLDRLIDEQTSFKLVKINKNWFPNANIPINYDNAIYPKSLTYNEYRTFNNWVDFVKSSEYNNLLKECNLV